MSSTTTLPGSNVHVPDIAAEGVWKPRRASLALVELPPRPNGAPAGFNVAVVFSRDPEQQQDTDANEIQTVAVVDIAVMALVDIVKTAPPAFVDRFNAIQERFVRIAERVVAGDDARDAAKDELSTPLIDKMGRWTGLMTRRQAPISLVDQNANHLRGCHMDGSKYFTGLNPNKSTNKIAGKLARRAL